MVFRNERLNGTGNIIVYSNYHRYWTDKAAGLRNPKFDVFSGKRQGEQGVLSAAQAAHCETGGRRKP